MKDGSMYTRVRRPVDIRRSRSAAGLAYLAGLGCLVAGIGLGAGHLAKDVVDVTAVAGLAILAAGVALAVVAVAVLVRGVHGWRRPLLVVAALVVTFAVVFPAWPAVYAAFPPRPAAGPATPADRGLAYQDVRFPTADGQTLAGWYLPSGNAAAVVLLPGAGSDRSAVLPQAAVLAGAGYGVLLVDPRGHGASTGRGMEFGWYGDQDIAAAVSFLLARPEVDAARIGAIGMSMGGEQALGALAADPRIRAVVAEGATGRTADDLEWLSDTYGVRGAVTEGWQGVLTYGLVDLLTPGRPPVSLHDAVAAAGRPVLLVVAGDVPDERAAAEYIRSGSPDAVRVWEVPDTGHTQGLATHPDEWRARVVAFLDGTLGEGR